MLTPSGGVTETAEGAEDAQYFQGEEPTDARRSSDARGNVFY